MSAAQPESKPASELGSAAPSGSGAENGVENGGSPARPAAAPAMPPTTSGRTAEVNSRGPGTSNSKEIRAREAEEDRALITKAQAGDTAAFRSLVERHQRRAFAIAYSLVRDENDARELVQDAFLRVFKGLGTFQGGSSFFTWLYRIVTNLSIDLMRKPGRAISGGVTPSGDLENNLEGATDHDSDNVEFPLLSKIDGADPVDVLRRREIAARIQTALDALPPYHRSVIVMREVEGLSYDEMAHVMGVSKGTIMSRLFHARQKLQRALCDCYEEQIGAMKVSTSGEKSKSEPAPSDAADSDEHSAPESSESPRSSNGESS